MLKAALSSAEEARARAAEEARAREELERRAIEAKERAEAAEAKAEEALSGGSPESVLNPSPPQLFISFCANKIFSLASLRRGGNGMEQPRGPPRTRKQPQREMRSTAPGERPRSA